MRLRIAGLLLIVSAAWTLPTAASAQLNKAAPVAEAKTLAPLAVAAPAGYEKVELTSKARDSAKIAAYVRRPSSDGRVPVVVSLHGCGGLFNERQALHRREIDWADRFVSAGYAVLLVDSFNPRGFRELCTLKSSDRRIRPAGRALDVAAAMNWVAFQPTLDKDRIAIVGWSNGGSTVLSSVDRRLQIDGVEFKTAIAFYPGCRLPAESEAWAPRVPLTILMGAADDWTQPGPCRALAAKHSSIRYIEYPGAVHGFDAPDTPRRTRKGLGLVGEAQIGTDPAARAASIAEVERILKEAFK